MMAKDCNPPTTSPRWMHDNASARSSLYGLLALVFRDRPTPELVAQLGAPPLAGILDNLGYDVATALCGELESVAARLGEEYTRVFVGPGQHAPLYASVYHEGEGKLWGDSTVRVKRFIEALGLSFADNWESIPDHIAIQLELMQRLTAHEAQLYLGQIASVPAHHQENQDEQLRRCLEVEEQFLRDNLCKWVPQFCDHILKITNASFYREMAKLAKSIVLADMERVATGRAQED